MKKRRVLSVMLSAALASPFATVLLRNSMLRADDISLSDSAFSEGVSISPENFPDDNFRAFVSGAVDDGDGMLSEEEISKVDYIDVSESEIDTLKGIEFFTELESLVCFSNNLKELDVSQNTKLYELAIFDNPLTEVDISSCPILVNIVKTGIYEENEIYCMYALSPESGDVYCVAFSAQTKLILEKQTPDPVDPVLPDPDQPDPDFPDPDPDFPDPDDPDPDIPEPDPEPDPLLPDPNGGKSFEEFIERLYVVALNRPSEASGKAFWMDKILNEGFSGGRCAIGFLIEAPEFLNRGLTNEQFVDVLYRTFFDREADADGKAFWMGHLATDMTREQVVRGFIDSKEWCNLCALYGVKSGAPNAKAETPSNNALRFAYRLYSECLGRRPDADGLYFWALRLTNLECTGAQAAKDFFTSKEFKNQDVNDVEFVTRLYHTFMDRTPDGTGMGFWLQNLATGMTREQVIKGFAESDEFTKICKQYGIERGTL